MKKKTTAWTLQATNKRNLTGKTWTGLRKGSLKKEIKTAQNNAIRTMSKQK